MNIFALDLDPQLAALYHVDSHVIKMITESAQMMSTAVRLSGIDAGYKIAYSSHPCTIWVRTSLTNWRWLGSLCYYLNVEYRYRYNHDYNHKSYDVIASLPLPNIPDHGLTKFAQAMPTYRRNDDTVTAYRNYYNAEKYHLFKWTKREIPKWITLI